MAMELLVLASRESSITSSYLSNGPAPIAGVPGSAAPKMAVVVGNLFVLYVLPGWIFEIVCVINADLCSN